MYMEYIWQYVIHCMEISDLCYCIWRNVRWRWLPYLSEDEELKNEDCITGVDYENDCCEVDDIIIIWLFLKSHL